MPNYLELIKKNEQKANPILDLSNKNPQISESLPQPPDLEVLPESLYKLNHLEELNLSFHPIKKLTANFSKHFPNLKHLILHGLELPAIPNIYGLDLDWSTYQQFKTTLDTTNVIGIRYQAVNNNNDSPEQTIEAAKLFLKTIAEELPHLQYLIFNNSEFGVDRLPAEIGNLAQLKVLDLAHNSLRVLHKNIEKLLALEVVNLSNNRFSELPEALLKLPKLKQLNLSENFIQRPNDDFGKLHAIETLDLSKNGTLSLPKSLSKLQTLRTLVLRNYCFLAVDTSTNLRQLKNQLKGQIQETVREKFEENFLTNTPISQAVEAGKHLMPEREENTKTSEELLAEFIPIIASISTLENLDLSENSLYHLPSFKGLEKLKSINIAFNSLSDFPNSLSELQGLECLNISHNSLNWEQDVLFSLSNLRILYARNTYSYGSRIPNTFNLLPKLEELYLDFNNFPDSEFLDTVFQLPHLEILVIHNASLGRLPDSFNINSKLRLLIFTKSTVQRLPNSIGNLKDLYLLDLCDNPITELPSEIGQLEALEYLNLYDNELLELPQECCDLSNLEYLNVASNKLVGLPKRISRLTKLQTLDVRDNHFGKVPVSLSFLTQLKELDISSCGLRRIPKEVLLMSAKVTCHSNPLISPPSEIAERGKEAMLAYFEDLEQQKSEYLYEAKLLIVGSPGAGKTTLRMKLIDANCSLPTAEDSTDGIDVETLFFDLPQLSDKNRFRINIWDFGGQELYHSTHQFFFTRRSLYVLVLNTRRDDDRIDYWLHTLRIFSGESPVIILQNQEKDRTYPLNEQRYRAQYPNIKEFIAVNLSQAAEIPKLLHKIRYHIQALSHIGQEIPAQWMDVRQRLAAKAKSVPYIDFEEFAEICGDYGIEEEAKVLVLSSYLHDLGAILHFGDNRILRKVVFLRNNWVIDAAYRVLDNDLVKNQQGGRFYLSDLDQIWANPEYLKVKDELLELMLKFEVCFQIPDSTQFIVPQLLAPNPPDFQFPEGAVANFRYQYDFMPRGLLTRFIVQMHHYIQDHSLVWKEGVVLKRLDTFAKVVEDYDGRCILIQIGGSRLKELLAIITDEFERLHQTYPQQLQVQKLIPCNCSLCAKPENEPYLYDYQKLMGYIENKRDKVVCDKSFKDVSIQPLLDGIQNPLLTGKSEDVQILFLAANPKDTQALDLDKEVEILREVVESGRHQERIRIDQRWEVSFDKLQQTILKLSPQIIHFSGHGMAEGLLLENESGFAEVVSADTLGSLFGPLQQEVFCVILNACYSENQAKVIGTHIPFVVGMNTAISDEAALLFTRGFYRGLANRLDIEFAFSMGLSLVQSKRPDQVGIFVLWKEGKMVGGL